MKPDFMDITANIIAEIRPRTCIDRINIEVIRKILQNELKECYDFGYIYGYENGFDDGYDEGESSLD